MALSLTRIGVGIVLFARLERTFVSWVLRIRTPMMVLSNLAILGSVIGIITNLFPVDPTPFIGSVTAALCALILYRYRMSDVVRTGLSQAVEQMGDAIVVADRDGVILDANHAFGQLVGFDRALLIGIPVAQAAASPSALIQGSTSLPELLSRSTWDSLDTVSSDLTIGEGDSTRSYSLTAWPILGKRGPVLGRTLALRDVSEARALTDRLAQLLDEARANATTDVLTGLPNHRHLMDRLDQEEEAVAELKKGAGTQFDPDLLRSFLKALGCESDLPAPPAGMR